MPVPTSSEISVMVEAVDGALAGSNRDVWNNLFSELVTMTATCKRSCRGADSFSNREAINEIHDVVESIPLLD